jgi:hypothetical protein
MRRRRAAPSPPPITEAPRGGGHRRWPFSPRFPAFPRARLLTGASPPHLTVARLPRPPALRLNPVDAFPSSLSFSQAKPELNPRRESRLRGSPTSRRRGILSKQDESYIGGNSASGFCVVDLQQGHGLRRRLMPRERRGGLLPPFVRWWRLCAKT